MLLVAILERYVSQLRYHQPHYDKEANDCRGGRRHRRDLDRTLQDRLVSPALQSRTLQCWHKADAIRLLSYGEKTLSPDKRPTNLMLAHKISHVRISPSPS